MGREQWFLTPKDGISLLGIRSKIERQGVRKREVRKDFSFFVIPFAGVVAPVAARQICLRSVNVQCCYATLES
jgi:hypothetical protein